MVDVPMPRGNPADEKYRALRSALDVARRDVIEANKRRPSGDELLELRHCAYRAWQALETYLRTQGVIPEETPLHRG